MHIAHYSKTLYSTVAKATDLPPLLGWFTNGLNFVIVSCRPVIELFYPPINLSETIQNLSGDILIESNDSCTFVFLMSFLQSETLTPFSCTFLSRPFPFFWKKNVVVFVIDSIQFVTISFVYVKNHLDSLWSVCQLMVWKSENRVAVLAARAPVVF